MPTHKPATRRLLHLFVALAFVVTPSLYAETHAHNAEVKASTAAAAKPMGSRRVTAKDVAKFKALAENQDHAAYKQKFDKATGIIVDEIKSRETNAYWAENTAAYLASIGSFARSMIINNIVRSRQQKDMGVAPLFGYVFESSAALRKIINKVSDNSNSFIVRNIMFSININKTPTIEQVAGIHYLFASFDDAALPYALSWLSPEKRKELEELLSAPISNAHPKAQELAKKVHAYRKNKGCKAYGTKIPGPACDGLGL